VVINWKEWNGNTGLSIKRKKDSLVRRKGRKGRVLMVFGLSVWTGLDWIGYIYGRFIHSFLYFCLVWFVSCRSCQRQLAFIWIVTFSICFVLGEMISIPFRFYLSRDFIYMTSNGLYDMRDIAMVSVFFPYPLVFSASFLNC